MTFEGCCIYIYIYYNVVSTGYTNVLMVLGSIVFIYTKKYNVFVVIRIFWLMLGPLIHSKH